jgi:hypothetical protein
MGTWGTDIFEDDTAADVRDNYRDLVASGVSDSDALTQIETQFLESEPSIRKHVEPLFWLALARTQWEIGRLDEGTRSKAIEVIDSGKDLENWRALGAKSSDIALRTSVLAALRTLLVSPQKPRKKLRQRKQRISPYKVGDVVSFGLSTGRFVLFRITSIAKSGDGEDPVAEILDWVGTSFPSPAELTAISCRQRTKPAKGFESVRFPRILLADLPGMKFDRNRLTVIARGLPMPPVTSESFSMYPFAVLEQALAEEFGLK